MDIAAAKKRAAEALEILSLPMTEAPPNLRRQPEPELQSLKDVIMLVEALEEAQGKLEAVREQAAYGFTGETLANMKDGLSGKAMNIWWMQQLDRILRGSKEDE